MDTQAVNGTIMEVKDWIVLAVPIICNGFIVFLFQRFISAKIVKSEKAYQLREQIVQEYINLLRSALASIRSVYRIRDEVRETNEYERLKEALINLKDALRKLYYYYDDYKLILTKGNDIKYVYARFRERFEEWVMKQNDIEVQKKFLDDCEDILHLIMDACLKDVFDIK